MPCWGILPAAPSSRPHRIPLGSKGQGTGHGATDDSCQLMAEAIGVSVTLAKSCACVPMHQRIVSSVSPIRMGLQSSRGDYQLRRKPHGGEGAPIPYREQQQPHRWSPARLGRVG